MNSGYPNLEIIVIDDCSKDGTPEEVAKLFPNIKVVTNDKECLLAACRNIRARANQEKYDRKEQQDWLVLHASIRSDGFLHD